MARKGPLLTLLGGGVLAGGLLVASVVAAGEQRDDVDPIAAGANGTAEPTPTTEATPTPEPTPTAGLSQDPEAPAAEEEPDPITYVGDVDGGGASVAIVLNGEEATAYVCDGEIEAWLQGDASAGELALSGDGAELTATYDEDSAAGEVTALGEEWSFTVEQVDAPEGLYRVADTILGGAEVEGGWIVLPDGRQVGVLTVDGESASAPELDTDTGQVTVDGETVTADKVG
jgi:hypothetical protein